MINNIYVLFESSKQKRKNTCVGSSGDCPCQSASIFFCYSCKKYKNIKKYLMAKTKYTYIIYNVDMRKREKSQNSTSCLSYCIKLYNIQYPPARKQSQVIHQFFLLIKIYKKESKSQRLYYILLTFFSHAVTNFCCVLHT